MSPDLLVTGKLFDNATHGDYNVLRLRLMHLPFLNSCFLMHGV